MRRECVDVHIVGVLEVDNSSLSVHEQGRRGAEDFFAVDCTDQNRASIQPSLAIRYVAAVDVEIVVVNVGTVYICVSPHYQKMVY